MGIISGSIWGSFQGWGSFRGRDYFGGCTDIAMPANLGYICVLLYNQNNCTVEGPTVTTSFELEIGTDLCVMMAYDKDKSMGHLVTGGSIANIKTIWAARNVKFFPLALQRALKKEKKLAVAKDYKVHCMCLFRISQQ